MYKHSSLYISVVIICVWSNRLQMHTYIDISPACGCNVRKLFNDESTHGRMKFVPILLTDANPLGLENGDIQDHQMTASTVHVHQWEAWGGRLNHKGPLFPGFDNVYITWIANVNNDKQWLQVFP